MHLQQPGMYGPDAFCQLLFLISKRSACMYSACRWATCRSRPPALMRSAHPVLNLTKHPSLCSGSESGISFPEPVKRHSRRPLNAVTSANLQVLAGRDCDSHAARDSPCMSYRRRSVRRLHTAHQIVRCRVPIGSAGRRRVRPSVSKDACKASLSRHPGNVSRPNACLVPAGSSGNDEIRGKVFPVAGPPRFFLSIPGPGSVRSDNHLKWIDVENPRDCETDFVVEYADPAPVAAHCGARNAEGF